MSKDKQRAAAAKGGKSAHAKGTAFEWDRYSAAEAGRKGGAVASARRRARTHADGG